MGGGLWLLRIQFRRSWRAQLALLLLIGVAGGLVLAGVAGARRTQTAYPRMLAVTKAWDALVNPNLGNDSTLTIDDIRAQPEVAQAARIDGVLVVSTDNFKSLDDIDRQPVSVASDDNWPADFGRPLVRSGRLLDPARSDEVFMSRTEADSRHLKVGDRLTFRVFGFDDFNTLFTDGAAALPTIGQAAPVTVVGIGEFQDSVAKAREGGQGVGQVFSRAFYEKYGSPSAGFWAALVRLKDPGTMASFRSGLDGLMASRPFDPAKLSGSDPPPPGTPPNAIDSIVYQTRDGLEREVLASTAPQSSTLLAFAGVAAAFALLVIGQSIWRRLQVEARDNATFDALGLTHRGRFRVAMAGMAVVGVGGALVAVALAVALSPLTPIGIARTAEPDLGLDFNARILGWGGWLIVVVTLLLALLPAWRTTRVVAESGMARPSIVASVLAGAGVRPPVVAGARLALEAGRGRTSVPVRTTLIGAATGVILATATFTFTSSLDHFVGTPGLNGTVADAAINLNSTGDTSQTPDEVLAPLKRGLDANPAVESWTRSAAGEWSSNPHVGSGPSGNSPLQFITGWGGTLSMAQLIEGRPPRAGEIVVGRRTLDQWGLAVGDTVSVGRGRTDRQLRIVGTAVFPAIAPYPGSDKAGTGRGGWVTFDDAVSVGGISGSSDILVKLRTGTSLDDLSASLQKSLPPDVQAVVNPPLRPSVIESLDELHRIPLVLSLVLAGLVGATVAHALASAVWRRRRDLALMQTVGFTRGQVRQAVFTQATLIGVIALVVGLPVGVLIGRAIWTVFQDRLGTVAGVVVPWTVLGIVVVVVLALVNLVGLVPAFRLLRRHPAETLRSE